MTGLQKSIKILAICFAVFIITSIASGILFIGSIITDFSKVTNKLADFGEIYENVNKIDIDISAAKLTIKQGETFKVEATNINDNFKVTSIDNNLKIKETSKWHFNKKNVTDIILYIPQGFLLDELTINNGAGKLEINNILATNFKLNQGAGVITITDSRFNNSSIKGGVGEINIFSSVLSNLDLNAGVGSINIEANIIGNNKIKCGIGEIDLHLLGNKSDYQINVSKGIGNIKIDNVNQANNTVYGNGNNKLEINGGIGEISISFNN